MTETQILTDRIIRERPLPVHNSDLLGQLVAQGMSEKKGVDIVVLDLRHSQGAVTDFFVICSGTSDTHVEALMDAVEEEVFKALGEKPWHREGKAIREWILLDYVNVVAHIFKKDRRTFYGLEDLWGDAVSVPV
jgi:ribosome-associated protein